MNITMLSTGAMVKEFLLANDFTILDLANASKQHIRTIYRFINGECPINYHIAEGIHLLIEDLSVSFLLEYDAKYEYQKTKRMNELNINKKEIERLISKYKLKKFFPNLSSDIYELFEHACNLLGKNNLLEERLEGNNIWLNTVKYSKANNADEYISKIWTVIAYKEYLSTTNDNLLKFDKSKFEMVLDELNTLSKVTSIDMTIYNMRYFCKECGINFYYRESVPGSRIKGMSFRDNEGNIFLFISNLFKCIENLWITFVHELMHIKNDDFSPREIPNKDNEKNIEEEAIQYFTKDKMQEEREYSLKEIMSIAIENDVPCGIVAEIARFRSKNYKNYAINSLIHYFKA